jgi:uncharacterized protein YozE (UPF0346 family)
MNKISNHNQTRTRSAQFQKSSNPKHLQDTHSLTKHLKAQKNFTSGYNHTDIKKTRR